MLMINYPYSGTQNISESMNGHHNLRSHFEKWHIIFLHLTKTTIIYTHTHNRLSHKKAAQGIWIRLCMYMHVLLML